jgi:hypothetical protein
VHTVWHDWQMSRLTMPAAILLALVAPAASAQEVQGRPVFSPDGQTVAYIRGADESCPEASGDQQIWISRADGSGARSLLRSRKATEPEAELCGLSDLQFISDGTELLFISQAWATSGAAHVVNLASGEERYLLPANDLLVLNFCAGEIRDALLVNQHRYFAFGGSYDWYWLYSADGSRQLASVGPVLSHGDLLRRARDDYRCSR